MELKDTVEMMTSPDYKERLRAGCFGLEIRSEKRSEILEKMSATVLNSGIGKENFLFVIRLCRSASARSFYPSRLQYIRCNIGVAGRVLCRGRKAYMSEYFILLDPKNNGKIVKADGRIQYQFIPGEGWVRSGILLEYQIPESPLYDLYKQITEKKALNLIGIKS